MFWDYQNFSASGSKSLGYLEAGYIISVGEGIAWTNDKL